MEKHTTPVSVLILTKDEEKNLPGCIDSVAWSDDIHVLDSYSTDRTVEIAKSAGAIVAFRTFDNFAQHQNWALENIAFKNEWVFYLDADERVTPFLATTIAQTIAEPGEFVAFEIQRRDFFLGTWLRHVQATSKYLRLFRPNKMTYERLGHCVSKPNGPTKHINGFLDHFPFSKGMADWYQRHNFYSSQEAIQIQLERSTGDFFSLRAFLGAENNQVRRQQLKRLFYRLPCRPLIKFVFLYFVKLGFLDGRAGFTYAILMAFYEQMIILKVRELSHGT